MKQEEISIKLPSNVTKQVEMIAKLAGVSVNTVIKVILASWIIKGES